MSTGLDSQRLLRAIALTGALLLGALAAAQQADEEADSPLDQIQWTEGPAQAQLGSIAGLNLPPGHRFADGAGARQFLELLENPVSGGELGLVICEEEKWFVIFEYEDCGYVKDDEKDSLDADALLASIRQGTEAANKERRKRGWGTLELVGWEQPPHYDNETRSLVWATRGRSADGDSVNYNTRRLGRSGVMSVTLVLDPEDLERSVPAFNKLMAGFSYNSGSRYGDFQAGDKIAQYGLTALIAGGAAAVAVKSGLFKYLWKLILVAIVGIGAVLKGIFGRKQAA